MKNKEQAIPLILYRNDTQTYEVSPEAIQLISSLPAPIGIVGVAGMYRTGKSYLLNRMLLDRSDGFGVGPTVNPCTKGLWIWGKPLFGQTSDGSTCSILVVDSEGLGALDEDSTHDIRIFSLTILLTSCFIYNSVGSIDENAIQNLSLVVNLTKNIQLKNNQQNIDLEDLSQYFPQFFWVVRDFTLQLVDKNGEQISSKEYLDNALQIQKGYSDEVESKNRIRRLLTTFFKERDCITLVRPLTEESNLQNLEQLDFDKLRPEFLESVGLLRKRIFNNIKPKMMNGKALSGQMYCDLMQSYVQAINKGAVPAIESAWTYICKNESQKAMIESYNYYEQLIKEQLHSKKEILITEDLKTLHKALKQRVLSHFQKRSLGDSEEMLLELKEKIRAKFYQIKTEHDNQGAKYCLHFIQSEYQSINLKVKQGEYKSFEEYEKEFKQFYKYVNDNIPKIELVKVAVLDYLLKLQAEGTQQFIKDQSQNADLYIGQMNEMIQKLKQELGETKQEKMQMLNDHNIKLNQLQSDKIESEVREQVLKENLSSLQAEKEQLEKDLKQELVNEKTELTKQIQQLRQKLITAEECTKDLERHKLVGNSEFEKDKALFQQKTSFYEKQLIELNEKIAEQQSTIGLLKNDYQQQLKDAQAKFDVTIRQNQFIVNDLQEKISELENELNEKEQNFENDYQRFDHKEKALNLQNLELNESVKQLQREIKELRRNDEQQQNILKSDINNQLSELVEKVQIQQEQLKAKDDLIKQNKTAFDKDKALMAQKMEFMEVQLEEYKNQIEENKKAHDVIMKAFESTNSDQSHKIDANKLNEIRDQHKSQIRQMESEYENNRKKLQQQIDALNEKNSELELKVKFETGDLQKELENLKEQLKETEEQRNRLLEQNKQLDGQKLQMVKDQELRYQSKIKQLENSLEQADQKLAKEVNAVQSKAEESLAQLKNFYETERQRLERRICEEKEKNEKKYALATEEYQNKLAEQESNLVEELENVKEQWAEQDQCYQSMINQLEHDKALLQQQVDSLDKQFKDAKEQFVLQQNNINAQIEQQISAMDNDRRGQNKKIDQLTNQLSQLQKDYMALQSKKDQIEQDKLRKEEIFEEYKKTNGEERKDLQRHLDETKQKLQKVIDELLERKIEFGKELALAQQQNEFQQKKIEDLQKMIDTQQQRFEEKLQQQKSEYGQDLQQKLDRAQEDKQIIDSKYEKLKKQLKESEQQHSRQVSALEREKAILTEKLGNLEAKKEELEHKLKEDSSQMSQQQLHFKEQLEQEKKNLQQELEKYKAINVQLETQKSEIHTAYETNKVLWEQQVQFLEQQKEQAKSDLCDALKKFEMTLMHMQRSKQSEKEESENNLQELVHNVEKKYQTQLDEANQTHQRIVYDLEDKIRRLQKELKNQKDKMLIDQHGKLGNQLLSEKKFAEMLDREKRLQQEIETVKQERDQKILEYQRMQEQEREQLKNKISDLEMKYKEVESKRSALIFEFEKERAKWNLDKDHLTNIKNELGDQVDKLEKKKEMLLRENEKLKNEQRAARRSVNAAHNMTSHTLLTGNKYKNPMNNISTIGLQREKLSPTHSNNTSTSSANISLLKKNNLADITNYTGQMQQNSKYLLQNFQQSQGDESILGNSSGIGQNDFQK